MKKFIDIHNHIIYNFDDGPESFEVTKKMLKLAERQNIRHIFATSHFDEYTSPGKLADYYDKFNIIKTFIQEEGLDVVIHPGAEVYYHDYMVDTIVQYKNYFLGESRPFVLFEFPMFQPSVNLEIIFKLRLSGVRPIVAHPERYISVMENTSLIDEFIKLGALIQINAGSILGNFGNKIKKIAQDLIEVGKVHFIASDAHGYEGRKFALLDAYEYLSKHVNSEHIDKLFFDNPQHILSGKDLKPLVRNEDMPENSGIVAKLFKKISLKRK